MGLDGRTRRAITSAACISLHTPGPAQKPNLTALSRKRCQQRFKNIRRPGLYCLRPLQYENDDLMRSGFSQRRLRTSAACSLTVNGKQMQSQRPRLFACLLTRLSARDRKKLKIQVGPNRTAAR